MNMKKVVSISGSTRQNSTNHSLLKAIAELLGSGFEVIIYEGIGQLPQFNPDHDGQNVPKEIVDFRQLLNDSAAIIICTPEYAHGVPGSLKNAIDWTISSSSFPHKQTMLITASTSGHFGHQALMETLRAIEARDVDKLQMVIPYAKTKISLDNKITDPNTLSELKKLIQDFTQTLDNE
ncbi:MAG: NADPH-dependent FMN reductase [Flavitalea sp.]